MFEPTFLNREGQRVDLAAFLRLHADPNYRFLRRDQVAGFEVVTAWLGLDQSLGEAAAPLIFGTIALAEDGAGPRFEGREWLSATEAEALANHEELIGRLRRSTNG